MTLPFRILPQRATGTFRFGGQRARFAVPLPRNGPAQIAIPFFKTKEQEYDYFAAIFEQHATQPARSALQLGRVSLLALRRSSSTLAHHGKGSYDDIIVVLRQIGDVRRASQFPICTEPGAQYSERSAPKKNGPVDARYSGIKLSKKEGVDINRDGIRDAGRLQASTYLYFEKPGGHLGARAFQVKRKQAAERDTDGDGRFSASDASRIDPSGAGTSMYIHRGGEDTVLEPNTWSAGCQTIPRNRYPRFLAAVGHAQFYYVLVDWC